MYKVKGQALVVLVSIVMYVIISSGLARANDNSVIGGFGWRCYARTIAGGVGGGAVGGGALGVASGLAFVPVEPVSAVGGAIVGATGGLAVGVVEGIFSC